MANTLTIEWSDYTSHPVMQNAVDYLNQRSLEDLLQKLPKAAVYNGGNVTFDYRIYSDFAPSEVEKVYIIMNGFGIGANLPDSGIKSLLADLLLQQMETAKYAVVVIGGLYGFPASVRRWLMKQGSGALTTVAEGVANLIQTKFSHNKTVVVSGYSLGGVLTPLVARVISERGIARVDQICCGEPNYIAVSSSRIALLRRVAHATAYRNDQIKSTAIQPYIAVKQTPDTWWAMSLYRARQYRPLLQHFLSMRFVVHELALQARSYPPVTHTIQVQESLLYLAKKGIRMNLLHAEFSSLCDKESFTKLVDTLAAIKEGQLSVITVRGAKADHGIEERGTLSTPFLVKPELYWAN